MEEQSGSVRISAKRLLSPSDGSELDRGFMCPRMGLIDEYRRWKHRAMCRHLYPGGIRSRGNAGFNLAMPLCMEDRLRCCRIDRESFAICRGNLANSSQIIGHPARSFSIYSLPDLRAHVIAARSATHPCATMPLLNLMADEHCRSSVPISYRRYFRRVQNLPNRNNLASELRRRPPPVPSEFAPFNRKLEQGDCRGLCASV